MTQSNNNATPTTIAITTTTTIINDSSTMDQTRTAHKPITSVVVVSSPDQATISIDQQQYPRLGPPIKRSESVSGRTLATMAESEYSIDTMDDCCYGNNSNMNKNFDPLVDSTTVVSMTNPVEQDPSHQPHHDDGDFLDDSLSSRDEEEDQNEQQQQQQQYLEVVATEEQVLAKSIGNSYNNNNNSNTGGRPMPKTKVPSSLHIPTVVAEETKEEDEGWESLELTTNPVLEMEDPIAASSTNITIPPSTNTNPTTCKTLVESLQSNHQAQRNTNLSQTNKTSTTKTPTTTKTTTTITTKGAAVVPTGVKPRTVDMIQYKPTDRSITVALTPAKSSLRRYSSYGNKNNNKNKNDPHLITTTSNNNDIIPLNFNKRGAVRVLPKPDLAALGRQALERQVNALMVTNSNNKNNNHHHHHHVPGSKHQVTFDKIAIREHRITLGDNPSCSYGTPISLDWDYMDFEELTLEDYEMHKFTSGRGRPRTLRQLYLNHFQRIERLQQEGYTLEEIKRTKHETNKTRKQREMTRFLAQAKVLVHLEDLVESAGRKVSRVIMNGTNQQKQQQFQQQQKTKQSQPSKLSHKEQQRQLLLKVMEGDDTVDTARVKQNETGSRSSVLSRTNATTQGRG
jgi:hypothetical protein